MSKDGPAFNALSDFDQALVDHGVGVITIEKALARFNGELKESGLLQARPRGRFSDLGT